MRVMSILKSKFFIFSAALLFAFFINLLIGIQWHLLEVKKHPIRYVYLKSIIYMNSGYAHLSRGMNRFTIEALESKVTEDDRGLLQALSQDEDSVTSMTSKQVLSRYEK